MDLKAKNQSLLSGLRDKLGRYLLEARVTTMHAEVVIRRDDVAPVFRLLKLDADFAFDMLLDVTAIDWLDSRDQRYEVIYHLLSLSRLHRLRVKVALKESDPNVESICDLWEAANYLERETWDMYGINFKNHPDQRRILMYDEFVGHPLRKDYPVQGKQPRIPLRHPEVRNTAVDMQRADLVQISSKSRPTAGANR